jgi:hypothetical protein
LKCDRLCSEMQITAFVLVNATFRCEFSSYYFYICLLSALQYFILNNMWRVKSWVVHWRRINFFLKWLNSFSGPGPPHCRVISPQHRSLPDNTQHSQETDIHVTGGIRTHNSSKRGAADQPRRWHDHRNQRRCINRVCNLVLKEYSKIIGFDEHK